MIDFRPVGYVIGILVAFLGATMIFPMLMDLAEGRGYGPVFAQSAVITMLFGGLLAVACSNGISQGLSIQQTFLLTTGVWIALPAFAALPFVVGSTEASFTDAFFEAVSGLTTTGATVFSGLDEMPKGILLWRGILQWLGGVGIIVVAMVFLPELRVGGMQVFRAEAFDTMGKILPRATAIATQISAIYLGLTVVCLICYLLVGMNAFDATVHALTTISTGGFSNYDASFGTFSGVAEYVASLFMILAALPFVRYVQLANGNTTAIFYDSQIRVFLAVVLVIVVISLLTLLNQFSVAPEQALRESVFNIVSIITGTGYASVDYMTWGGFLISVFFFIGLIGGCAGSTACSVKIFRYQIVVASVQSQLKRINSPHGVFIPRFEGKQIQSDVLQSVMSFFVVFFLTLGVLSVFLAMTGLDLLTSVSGAASAVANIGPGLGDIIGPSGNYAPLGDAAKWILIVGMLLGRLELLAVFVLFTPNFWRA